MGHFTGHCTGFFARIHSRATRARTHRTSTSCWAGEMRRAAQQKVKCIGDELAMIRVVAVGSCQSPVARPPPCPLPHTLSRVGGGRGGSYDRRGCWPRAADLVCGPRPVARGKSFARTNTSTGEQAASERKTFSGGSGRAPPPPSPLDAVKRVRNKAPTLRGSRRRRGSRKGEVAEFLQIKGFVFWWKS